MLANSLLISQWLLTAAGYSIGQPKDRWMIIVSACCSSQQLRPVFFQWWNRVDIHLSASDATIARHGLTETVFGVCRSTDTFCFSSRCKSASVLASVEAETVSSALLRIRKSNSECYWPFVPSVLVGNRQSHGVILFEPRQSSDGQTGLAFG